MLNTKQQFKKEAMYYRRLEQKKVVCVLCPHTCEIQDGASGKCVVRLNKDGTLYATSYGLLSGMALDPIEKKPLFKFYPGSMIFSIGGIGCNLSCPFCQNYVISKEFKDHQILLQPKTVEEVVHYAKACQEKGNIGLAYTYNEPTVNFEFVLESAIQIYKNRMRNILVTNGYINPEPLARILPFIDAVNVDLKGFSEEFYSKLGGSLAPVLESIIKIAESECHLEITNLVIQGENDSIKEMEDMCKWIRSINREIPLHINRSFPHYTYKHKKPTDRELIYRLRDIAWKHLDYVFVGNLGY